MAPILVLSGAALAALSALALLALGARFLLARHGAQVAVREAERDELRQLREEVARLRPSSEERRERSITAMVRLGAEQAADRAVQKYREAAPPHPAVIAILADLDTIEVALRHSAERCREQLGIKRPEPAGEARPLPAEPTPAAPEGETLGG